MKLDKDITWIQLVQHYLPGVSDDLAGYILWNETAFPFNGLSGVRRQLRALAKKYPETPAGQQ